MKNIKKITCILLAVAMAFCLAACGKSEESESETPAYSKGIDENGKFTIFAPLDYVTVPECKGIEIGSDITTVSEEALDEEYNEIFEEYPVYDKIKDAVVADGDQVNIDYVGYIDGVAFDGGSTEGNGTTVTIGVTSYIDDFLEQLIGHMPGDNVQVEVTFPDDYGNEELNGKDAVFDTTINYILVEGVPSLTDSYVENYLQADYGFTTVKELDEYLTENLKQEAIDDFLYDWIEENLPISSIPDEFMSYQKESVKADLELSASMYGYTVEDYLEGYGLESMEDFYEEYADNITAMCENTMRMQAIAETYEITVSAEDAADYYGESLGSYYSTYESIYGLPYMTSLYLNIKVLDFLTENAVME